MLFQITTLAGGLVAGRAGLRFFNFGAQPSAPSRIVKMLAGTLAIVPAWAALVLIHAGGDPPGRATCGCWLRWHWSGRPIRAPISGRHFGKQ